MEGSNRPKDDGGDRQKSAMSSPTVACTDQLDNLSNQLQSSVILIQPLYLTSTSILVGCILIAESLTIFAEFHAAAN